MEDNKELTVIRAIAADAGETTTVNVNMKGDRKDLKILVGLAISQLCSNNDLSMMWTAIECVYLARLAQKAKVKD